MQTCVDADVTKHIRKGDWGWWLCSYVSLPSYISVVVNRAIQLAWNKNGSISFISKSKKNKRT